MIRLSPHFALPEFLPAGVGDNDVPTGVLENLERLCVTLLEPLREAMGCPIVIHSGWRLPKRNSEVGGVAGSDHLTGRACDFHVADGDWEAETFAAFDWLRENKLADVGQLIMEDHRHARANLGSLWVHVSIPSPKHPGAGDKNQLLVSYAPGRYEPWREPLA